jgi:hypothetical protein
MRSAQRILVGLLPVLTFSAILLNAAMAQDTGQQSISLGEFKNYSRLEKR